MNTLVIVRGLPGSGKTTHAMKWLAEHPGAARINRDELRMLHYGNYWPGQQAENAITKIQHAQLKGLLEAGLDVICDDTNLRARTIKGLMRIAEDAGARVIIDDTVLYTEVEICHQRVKARSDAGGRHVPAYAIDAMYDKFLRGERTLAIPVLTQPSEQAVRRYTPRDPLYTETWLFDIDGTLAIMGDRSPYDWGRVGEDTLNEAVASAAYAHWARGHEVVFLSGRDASCRSETEAWLDKHLGMMARKSRLFMRPAGDTRKDSIVKSEIFWENVEPLYRNIVGVYDDRRQVVRTWRAMGLTCFDVADGDF